MISMNVKVAEPYCLNLNVLLLGKISWERLYTGPAHFPHPDFQDRTNVVNDLVKPFQDPAHLFLANHSKVACLIRVYNL